MELALDKDLEAPKKCLHLATDNQDTKKKIWLLVARYAVQQPNNIKQR